VISNTNLNQILYSLCGLFAPILHQNSAYVLLGTLREISAQAWHKNPRKSCKEFN